MAIESAVNFRRLARTGLSVFFTICSLAGVAKAQTTYPAPPPVMTGSIIPLQHPNISTNDQIYTIRVAPTGDVVMLGVAQSALYQMKAGTDQFSTIVTGSPLGPATGYQNEGLAMDAQGTIYVGARYPPYENTEMLRIPYNAAKGTWVADATADAFAANINVGGSQLSATELAFINDAAGDGGGTLIVGTQDNGNDIVAVPVLPNGTIPTDSSGSPSYQIIAEGLEAVVLRIATDENSNIYFIEDPINNPSPRANGLFMIPASAWLNQPCGHATDTSNSAGCIAGNGKGTAEANPDIERIDPTTNSGKYSGLTIDANGNIILTDETDSVGGQLSGELLVPNESGSPANVTSAAAFNWAHLRYLAPISSNASPTIDPRGFLWIPAAGTGYQPGGENPVPGTDNFVLWQFGADNLGSSLVGTATPTSTVYYSFTSTTTPNTIGFVGDDASDFSVVTTDPNPAPNTTTPAMPCASTATTAAGKAPPSYTPFTSCPVWIASTPTSAGVEGSELAMLDANGNVIPGSTAYVAAIGQAPAVSLLVPSAQTAIASGLVTPEQVATDSQDDAYVADPGQGAVLEFPVGSTSSTVGTKIGSGFTAPTGVAVDPAGDVYVADSGKVTEIPMGANGKLNTAGQTVISSTYNGTAAYGKKLQLATDAQGDVFVADASHAAVEKIPNSQFVFNAAAPLPVGSGFKDPTAVAVDNSGDVFVADGSTLYEVTEPFAGQVSITKTLAAPVTGLTIDPSGSIDVAQAGGVVRIPLENGAYNANNDTAVDAGIITSPEGIAIDPTGNLYVSDMTGGTPNLFQLSVNAFADFGNVGPFVPTPPMDIDVFNIGNEPLSLTATPTITSTDSSPLQEFTLTPASQFGCDTTGATTVAAGTDCILDVTLAASDKGVRTATMAVPTNAANVPASGVTANLTGTGVGNLCYTTTTFTLNPATGISYPGSTTASVSVTLNQNPPAGQTNPSGCTDTPSGSARLTLTPQGGGQTYSFTGTLSPGANASTTTIPAIDLPGGTYNVTVTYLGSTQFFGGISPASGQPAVSLVVAPITPTVTLTEPSGISPINGTYYVPVKSDTTLTAAVISSTGTPSGTVNFINTATGKPLDSTQVNVPLNADGQATFNTDNLTAGTYTVAVQSNSSGTDPNFASTTSNSITFQVVGESALITANPTSMTTTAGTPATTTLTVQGLASYAGDDLQLSCVSTSLPQYSECTFTVPIVNLKSSPISQSVLSVSTDVPVNVNNTSELRMTGAPVVFAGAFGLGLLGLTLRKRRKFRSAIGTVCLLLVFCGTVIGFTGCTNSGYTKAPPAPHVVTPPGTYNVQVIGTDPTLGVVTLPFTISLTVNAAK